MSRKPSVAIIGAGPHALAVAARLLEGCSDNNTGGPSDTLFADPDRLPLDQLAVFDPSGQWLFRWNSLFESLAIPHLRSTVVQHPQPHDKHALLEFARRHGRMDEVVPLTQLFRKASVRKTNRFNLAQSYEHAAPGSRLFYDFCVSLVRRLGLDKVLVPSKVLAVEPLEDGTDTDEPRFRLKLDDGSTHDCDRVIVAVGPTNYPRIPHWARPHMDHKGIVHAFREPAPKQSSVEQPPRPRGKERVLVVGGGLTACHVAIRHFKSGDTVTVAVRRTLQMRQFDANGDWVGRDKARAWSRFLGSCPEERLASLKQQRKCGTVSPELCRKATELQQSHPETFRLLSNTVATRVSPLLSTGGTAGWSVQLQTSGREPVESKFDRIVLATGSHLDVRNECFLASVFKRFPPAQILGGFPELCSDTDLSWSPDCRSLHVVGAYASLSLGPMAQNLAGASLAAALLCDAILPGADEQQHDNNGFGALALSDDELSGTDDSDST